MTPPDPIDNRLTALRMLHVAGMVVTSGFAGVAVFSATRIGGPIFPGPVVTYSLLAVGLVLIAAVVFLGPLIGVAAGRTTDPGFPAFAADRTSRAALLLVPGLVFVGGFFVTQNWLVLAPLPLLHLLLLVGLPTRRQFDRHRPAE